MSRKNKNQMPLSVNWTVQDDRELKVMLQDEIRQMTKDIRSASNPTRKRKLRDRRKKFRGVLQKVNRGDYGSEQFFLSEQNQGIYVNPNPPNSEAVSAYDDISFRYDEYFRKKRYYGFFLPFLLFLLSAVLVLLPFFGNILPSETLNTVGAESIHLGALFTYKVDETNDVYIKNDGNWPIGVWEEGKFLEQGEIYKNTAGAEPEYVSVYRDLGLRSVDITGLDLLKAFFRTELFVKNGENMKIDFIDNLPFMKGNSWYYVRFMLNKDLTTMKKSDGTYNWNAVGRILSTHIIVYGFILGLAAAVLSLVFALVSMFGYTSRRFHLLPLLTLIVNVFLFLLPALLRLDTMSFGASFGTFFLFTTEALNEDPSHTLMSGILPIIGIAVSAIVLILPKLFKNKAPRYQTYVPKGNKPRRKSYDKLTLDY